MVGINFLVPDFWWWLPFIVTFIHIIFLATNIQS